MKVKTTGWAAGKRRVGRRGPVCAHPMSLVELAIASCLTVIVVAAMIVTLTSISDASSLAAQHTTAMCLCQHKAEQLRSAPFTTVKVTEENAPLIDRMILTHTEAPQGVAIPCVRTTRISEESSAGISARRVNVRIAWTYRGRQRAEGYETIIYDFR